MSCVTCDGSGGIAPPIGAEWSATGEAVLPCPVCQGPHIRWMLHHTDRHSESVMCSSESCDKEVVAGWIIYAQAPGDPRLELDETILICCDDHVDSEAETLRITGDPMVVLPFCANDAMVR